MNQVQTRMYENLILAREKFSSLSKKKKLGVEVLIKEIIFLKYQMEKIADQMGYSKGCKTSIPLCKGECCKWHFPKKLNYLDFFVAIFHMPRTEQEELTNLIFKNNKNQCPILLQTGCYLSFEQRPILCTNAYPCFNDRIYWNEKEKKNIKFKKRFDLIDTALGKG